MHELFLTRQAPPPCLRGVRELAWQLTELAGSEPLAGCSFGKAAGNQSASVASFLQLP